MMENTLFLGNGFSRAIFRDIPSWGTLLGSTDDVIQNYTFLYEKNRLESRNRSRSEDSVKAELVDALKAAISEDTLPIDIPDLNRFGTYLFRNNVNNIITTNYDNGIELILCRRCGYAQDKNQEVKGERIYSIRTFKLFYNEQTGHRVKLWKIHGDLARIGSVTLGFDQYCGCIWKLNDYVKGRYKSSQRANPVVCNVTMKEKCETQKFDSISWAELFFRTNVYIVGFGMALTEIDIWWLLNKRARLQLEVPQLRNRITYIYNPEFEKAEQKQEIFQLLKSFGVTSAPIARSGGYIAGIFAQMEKKREKALP